MLSGDELEDGPAAGAAAATDEKDEFGAPKNVEKSFEVDVELDDDGSAAGAVSENDELGDSKAGGRPGCPGSIEENEELCDASRL